MGDYSKDDYYSKAQLKDDLGFTETMIRDLLGTPIERRNPFYRNASPMKLWPKDEVERVMATDEYSLAREKADKRRRSSEKANATKRAKTMRDIDEAIGRIRVKRSKSIKTLGEALNVGAKHKQELDDVRLANRARINKKTLEDYDSADDATKERWAVNYIRHELTEYDEELYETKGRVGKSEAYRRYKAAVLDRIAEAYPFLASECARQRDRKPDWIEC